MLLAFPHKYEIQSPAMRKGPKDGRYAYLSAAICVPV